MLVDPKKGGIPMRYFLCILLAFSLFGQSTLRQAAREGRELSPDAIPGLEAIIEVQPGNEEVRACLATTFGSSNGRGRRRRNPFGKRGGVTSTG